MNESMPLPSSQETSEQTILNKYGEDSIESLRNRVEGGIQIIERQLQELREKSSDLTPEQADSAMQFLIQSSDTLYRI